MEGNPRPTESSSDVKFEIGHVLFIDIVGYSKLLINEQSEQLQKLKEIVRGTEQVGLAEAKAKVLRLPTGDSGALCFVIALEAVKTLRRLLSIPAGLTVSIQQLKTDPVWDPIRNDPGFLQLLTGKERSGLTSDTK
jgi:hypothetical protein